MAELRTFHVEAQNLPEHARNAIHTDAGARAAGFPAALVAGVTTYAYLTHPLAEAWGEAWLAGGGGEVRFRSPVLAGDRVACTPVVDGDVTRIEALVGDGPPRAVLVATHAAGPVRPRRDGDELPPRTVVLDGELGSDYASRAGDDLGLFAEQGLVHPAVWPALGNLVVHAELARGAWIHTRSIVRHHALVAAGAIAIVRATVVDRFVRHGERAVLDVHIEVAGEVVASLEHEAIVALPGA